MRTSARRQGRIIGVSVDARGRPALRMALQTREQHIRREKATSNICTAQVLLAVMAGMYAVYHGPERLRAIAGRVHRLAKALAAGLAAAGREVVTGSYFDTITVRVPGEAAALAAQARDAGFNVRLADGDHIGLSLDETIRVEDVRGIIAALGTGAGGSSVDVEGLAVAAPDVIGALARKSPYLTHPVFHAHHSETEMLRYLRRLAAKDLALDRSMIPLGSCTMKLNATAEMIPVTFPGFAALHPFVPADQALGYRELCAGLERMLCAITGFDAVSLQPNAGSQGEYTGLLCIRRYHRSRGEGGRDVCLIPASAHGTNPASAIMAGMRVVVVACDANGNVDLADLELKAREHRERLGALMITYPSTHGVFEEGIIDVCNVVHEHGGQVYMDGANLNAMVGLCRPARIGADVSHINLHKTFCIPHGGGGPGMGPIGVRSHLAPYLPDHPVVGGVNPAADPSGTVGTVSAAPWGSAGILPISWAYIAMMGARGLRRATEVAILDANYVAARLDGAFPVLYPRRDLPRVVHRRERVRGARVHHRPAPGEGVVRGDGRRRREAARRFRVPCPDDVVPGAGHPDDRAHGERIEGRARSLLRRDAGDSRGDRGDRGGHDRVRRQRAGPRPAHLGPARRGALGSPLLEGAGVLPAARRAGGQVLAAGGPRRQRPRRPPPRLRLPAARGV